MSNGADFYGTYADEPDVNISGIFAAITSVTRRMKKQAPPNGLIAHCDMLTVADYHKAFLNDREIYLTSAEIKILQYMMINRGNTVSHRQIFSQINEDMHGEYELTPELIYNAIKRLRRKLREAAHHDYIETVKDVGYRLRTLTELKTER